MSEEWRSVLGYEGFYEVSNRGRVRSLDRTVPNRPGTVMHLKGRLLKAGTDSSGYVVVWLHRDGSRQDRRVATLVCEAWHGPRQEGQVVRHLDDVKSNNHPSNLRWGTVSENTVDKVRNGLHPMASKTHCKWGHPFSPENTYRIPTGGRACRTCAQNRKRRYRARNRSNAS